MLIGETARNPYSNMGFSIYIYMREREYSYRNNDDDNSYSSSICMVWCNVYYLFIHSTPGTHIYISQQS